MTTPVGEIVPTATNARAHPASRRGLRAWLVTGVGAAGLGLLALVVASYLGTQFGVQIALISLAVAVLPLGVVVPTFLWLDRFEAEPTRYLVLAFAWGALVATVVSALVNTTVLAVARQVVGPDSALLVAAVGAAPIVEESMKGLFVLLVWWFLRREFDGITDGMVYAGVTAAGFAFTENIQYLADAANHGAFAATVVARCIMTPFAHPMFTVLTGIGIGVAATSRPGVVRVIAPFVGWVLAVLAHALWNLAAFSTGETMLSVYLLIEVPVFLAFIALVVFARRREGRTIGRFLRPYADAGWLAPVEVDMLAHMGRRREALSWARVNGGRGGLRAMRDFQDAASELALLRRRMTYTLVTADDRDEEIRLLTELTARRHAFIGQRAI